MGKTTKVRMEGVVKRFADVLALDHVSFEAQPGEVLGLLGENGAGKTTLMNVLSGLYRADEGRIWIDGKRVDIASPQDAICYRIGMVHQHFELIPPFTGLENVIIGWEGTGWWLRMDRHASAVQALARRFDFEVDLEAPVHTLSMADQQKVEILKALYRGVDLLILDEPTTVLTPQESDRLLKTIRAMAAEGLTVIFITHKIREVMEHCDRLTVMREGRVVGTIEASEASEGRLVEMMIGERLPKAEILPSPLADDPPVLRVDGLTVPGRGSGPTVSKVLFSVARGEIVGLAGVAGNGQRELAEAIVGLHPVARGQVEINGRDVTRAPVGERIAQGLFYIPEDRMADGIFPSLTLAENLLLGVHRFAIQGGYGPSALADIARGPMSEYRIAAPHPGVRAAVLSGGNIQKLLIARTLMLAGKYTGGIMLAHNPTRGLDVRTAHFVRQCLLDFSRRQGGVLLISSDLDELIQLGHRILVMFQGRIVADLPAEAFDPYRIGRLMTGVGDRSPVGDARA